MAVDHDGPTALILSRQGIPVVTDGSAVEPGGAVVRPAEGAAQVVLLATGGFDVTLFGVVITFGWARWADDSIGIDRFGGSAPGAVALDELGINVDHVVARALALADQNPGGA